MRKSQNIIGDKLNLKKRIEWVLQTKVPVIVKSGNHIPKDKESFIVQMLDSPVGKIPEVRLYKNLIMSEGEIPLGIKPNAILYKEHKFYPILVKLITTKDEKKIPEFFNGGNTSTYGIYDPISDMTYLFLLPNQPE